MDQARINFLKKDFVQGFCDFVGYKPIMAAEGRFESRLDLEPRHMQQDGFAHAGVCATMADHTAGYAAFTLQPPDRRILTIEFKINFLKPAAGVALICRSRIISRGRTILPGESEIFSVAADGSEKLVAKAMVTMISVPAEQIQR